MEIIGAIVVGGIVLFMIARSITAGLFAISRSINVLAEDVKNAAERTGEQLREIQCTLDSLHTTFGGGEGESSQEYFETLNGPTIHHVLHSIDRHLKARGPASKRGAESVRLIG